MTRSRWALVTVSLLFVLSVGSAAQVNGPVQYVYDELGRLIAAIDANGNAAVYNYDAVGNILSINRLTSTQVSIISFTPDQGPQGGSVTIYGTGFSATASQNTVQFNGTSAAVVSATANQIVATVSTGATTGPISVTSPAGSATSSANFTVFTGGPPAITGFSPSIGAAGTTVTITGSNFSSTQANNRVLFNATPAAPASASTTSIGTAVPVGGASGHLSVSTPLGAAVSTGDFFVPFGTHTAADVAYTGRTTVGGSANVVLNTAPKIGLLVFDGTAGQRVNLQWTSTLPSCTVYLFAPSGAQVALTSCGTGSLTGALQNTLTATGTFTVGIEDPTSSTGSVNLQLTDVSDATGTITIDGPAVTTTTTKPYQDARLTFNATAEQKVLLKVTNVTNPSAAVALQSATGQTMSSLSIGNSPAGQTFIMDTQTLVATGAYTFWVQHSGTSVGSETLQLTSAPDVTGSITTDGTPVTTTTTKAGQDVRLKFSVTAGQRVFVRASNVTNPYATLYLVNPDGTNQASKVISNSAQTFFIDTQTLPQTGVYTLLVQHYGTNIGSETLQLNNVPADLTGPITMDGPAVRVPASGDTALGQNASLTFSATAGQRIVVQVTSVSNPSATVVLQKPDGTTQATLAIGNSPAGQLFFMDTQTLAAAGTYTLLVQHNGMNVGNETLQLNSVPPDFTAPITIGGAAVRVPDSGNNALGQNGSLPFTAAAGQKISITITNASFTPYTSCVLSLIIPQGGTQSNFYCGSGSPFSNTVTLSSAGTYTLLVDPQGPAIGTTTVQVNNDADVTGTIAVDGSPVTVTTTAPGQDGRLTFSATANQRIFLQVTNVSNPSAVVALVRPDGATQSTVAVNNNPAGQLFFIDTQTLTIAGTYTLWVQHSGSNTGSETLQLTSVPADYTGTLTINGGPAQVPATGNNAIGQNAKLTFSATAGQSLKINVSNSSYTPSSGCSLTLQNPAGSTLIFNYCGIGGPTPLSATAGSAGTYTIIVDPQGANTGSVAISVTSP